MSRFLIKKENPFKYHEQILKFWAEDLPDTPPGRLEWMMNGNPAGPAHWFFAFDQKRGEVAGMISVMPKDLLVNGQKIRAGIMGDLVVAKEYRVLGPALTLIKSALENMTKLGFDFIYTIPNPDSRKLLERAGFGPIGQFLHYVKPLDLRYYSDKYGNRVLSIIPTSFKSLLFKAISLETYVSSNGVEELKTVGAEFDVLFEKAMKARNNITSYRSSGFIKWRYFENPGGRFRVLGCRNKIHHEIQGYLAFAIAEGRMHIYDVFGASPSVILRLVKKLTNVASDENCVGIYVRLLDTNPLCPMLKKCCFFDTEDKAPVMVYPAGKFDAGGWDFFSGDRNI